MDHRVRRMGQRPHPWPTVQSAVSEDFGADIDRRYREVSGLRHDPRHRPGLRQEAGSGLRGEGILRPLLWFGLLDHRAEKAPGTRFAERHFYRKAPLFDRLLIFDVQTDQPGSAWH